MEIFVTIETEKFILSVLTLDNKNFEVRHVDLTKNNQLTVLHKCECLEKAKELADNFIKVNKVRVASGH